MMSFAAAGALAPTACTLLVDTEGLTSAVPVDAADALAPHADADADADSANAMDASAQDDHAPDAKPVPAGATVWPDNGHAYLVVAQAVTWDVARDASTNAGGHLVTIGSSAENDFVFSLVAMDDAVWQVSAGKDLGPWLGGYQSPGVAAPADGWNWVTSEPFSYLSWFPGQPNDANGVNETKLRYYGEGARSKGWADASTEKAGYIIEFE